MRRHLTGELLWKAASLDAKPERPDEQGVDWCRALLLHLGCPDVRRGEGSGEWERSKGGYPYTPDLIAGPLVGGGDPSDFYIDVLEPSGDQFFNPKAGNPHAHQTVRDALDGKPKSFAQGDLKDDGEQLLKPLNAKLTKYAIERKTPMFGLGLYFQMTGDQYGGPILAGFTALDTLDRAFGITHHLGAEAMETLRHALASSESFTVQLLALPMIQPISFVLLLAEKRNGPRAVLLVNAAVNESGHPYPNHPVIAWLRGLLATPSSP